MTNVYGVEARSLQSGDFIFCKDSWHKVVRVDIFADTRTVRITTASDNFIRFDADETVMIQP